MTLDTVIVKLLQSIDRRLTVLERLGWIQGLDAVSPTSFAAPVAGDAIPAGEGKQGASIYKNNTVRPITVRVFADFVTAGAQVRIGRSQELPDKEALDFIGNTPSRPSYGKVISDRITLPPGGELFAAATGDFANFPPVAADVLRIRVYDPLEIMSAKLWEPTESEVVAASRSEAVDMTRTHR